MTDRYTSSQLRALIQRVLTPPGYWSADAAELLLATCAQESLLGQYRHQVGGPALGIFQMEPATHDDCWTNFIVYRPELRDWLHSLSFTHTAQDLVDNDPYAIAMARVRYERAPGALPSATDLHAMFEYYKQNYNGPGAATEAEFRRHYAELIMDGAAS